MKEKNLTVALQQIDAFLQREMDTELRSSVLGMRAQLKEDLGDQEGAKADLLSAISIGDASFTRYVNESSLAGIYRLQGNYPDATKWYRAALRTSVDGDFPGGAVLRNFLALQPEKSLSKEDRALCIEVVQGSWKLLGLEGGPDVTDLAASTSIIVEREASSPN